MAKKKKNVPSDAELRDFISQNKGEEFEGEELLEYTKEARDMLVNTPRVLYKYCASEKCADILRDSSFLLSSPEKFNDPFDMKFLPVLHTDEETKAYIYRNNRKPADKLNNLGRARRLKKSITEPNSPLLLKIQAKIKTTGITCFSEDNANILMWGHYAKEHQGICLGFNPERLFHYADLSGCVPAQIIYSDSYPKWQPNQILKSIRALRTKAQCWAYEREWRLMGDKKAGGKLPFSKDALKSIIFGIKASDKNISEICNLVSNMGYCPTFYKAEALENDYKINIKPLNKRR